MQYVYNKSVFTVLYLDLYSSLLVFAALLAFMHSCLRIIMFFFFLFDLTSCW